MRSVIAYNLARFALLAVVAGVLYLLGARGLLLLGAAILISGLISFVLLSRLRDAMSAALDERVRRVRGRLAEAQAREDVPDEDDADEDAAARDEARGEPGGGREEGGGRDGDGRDADDRAPEGRDGQDRGREGRDAEGS